MIRTEGLSISTDDFLAQARVPAHEGDVLTQSSIAAIVAVKSYDEHLAVIWLVPSGEPKLIDLNIVAPDALRIRRWAGEAIGSGWAVGDGAYRVGDGISAPIPIFTSPAGLHRRSQAG
jgi:hypothetical protein